MFRIKNCITLYLLQCRTVIAIYFIITVAFPEDGLINEFIDSIYEARGFGVNTDESFKLREGDHILVLSTCLQGNDSKRYLVLARLEEINI